MTQQDIQFVVDRPVAYANAYELNKIFRRETIASALPPPVDASDHVNGVVSVPTHCSVAEALRVARDARDGRGVLAVAVHAAGTHWLGAGGMTAKTSSGRQFIDILSILDITLYLLHATEKPRSNTVTDDIPSYPSAPPNNTIMPKQPWSLEVLLARAMAQPIRAVMACAGVEAQSLWRFDADTTEMKSLLEVLSKGVHRVLVASSTDKRYGVVSQMDVIRWLAGLLRREDGSMMWLGGQSLGKLLPQAQDETCTDDSAVMPEWAVTPNASIRAALERLTAHGHYAMAVVAPEVGCQWRLLDTLSLSDLRNLDQAGLAWLAEGQEENGATVEAFFQHVLHRPLPDRIILASDDQEEPAKELMVNCTPTHQITVTRDTTYAQALQRLLTHDVHRVWLVKAVDPFPWVNRVYPPALGCVSTTDLIAIAFHMANKSRDTVEM